MLKSVLLSTVLIVTAAGSAMAAPGTNLGEYRAIDRWVDIFHPEELVGPPVDPQLKKNFKMLAQPEPEPWKGNDPHPEEIGVKQLEIGF